MALLIKNNRNAGNANAVVDQMIRVSKASATLPATTQQNIFRVEGGRVMVWALVGQVTTVVQAQTTNVKVTSTAKSGSSFGATVGTAVDVATNVDCNALEVGGLLFVEGDGTALVKNNAGASLPASGVGYWIAPIGIINIETGATSTGATKWDLYYQPLDNGAYVTSA